MQKKSLERITQEKAYALIFKIDWWFRRHYNLAPTDSRYLDMTPEGMEIEYWANELTERWEQAVKDGTKIKSLEDLLEVDKAMGDDEFERQLKTLEREDVQRAPVEEPVPSRVTPQQDDNEPKPMIHVRRPFHGRR